MEGIAIGFNPDYKVLGSTYPWIARKVLTDSSPQLRSSLENLLYKDGVFDIDRLESLLTESLRAKTDKTLVKIPSEGADSKMVMKEVLSFTLTEKGGFVRKIIVQEFAKGLDALGLASLETAAARVPFSNFFFSPLMTEEDKVNLRTFQRLMLLLSGARRKEDFNIGETKASPDQNQILYSEELSLVLNQFDSIQDILPVLSVIPELSPESQQQLLQLPANLVQQLISRAAARTIKRVFL